MNDYRGVIKTMISSLIFLNRDLPASPLQCSIFYNALSYVLQVGPYKINLLKCQQQNFLPNKSPESILYALHLE